jgi:hypothetical protein
MLSEQGPPLHRIVHKNTAFVRFNPLGVGYDGRFAYRLRLYESDSKSLRDNFLGIGVAPTHSRCSPIRPSRRTPPTGS